MWAQHRIPRFLFKSHSWPNQIWSWSDGWLHFRETTPLRDPGSPPDYKWLPDNIPSPYFVSVTHFANDIRDLLWTPPEPAWSITAQIKPEPYLSDSSKHPVCTQSRRYTTASPYLPTEWSRCPHVLASSVSQYYLLLSPQQTSSDKLSCQTSYLWLTAFSRADGGVCHPLSLDELFLPHMVVILIPGCLRIFWDTTSTDFTLVCSSAATKYDKHAWLQLVLDTPVALLAVNKQLTFTGSKQKFTSMNRNISFFLILSFVSLNEAAQWRSS